MRNLDYYRSLQRPATDVKVGDEVTVYMQVRGYEETGVVTSVARVWITVKALREYRFRRDTQYEGKNDFGCRFKTPEQAEFDQHLRQAERVLRDHRVDVVSRAIVPDGHLIAMADLLTALDTPEES
jgi:hypothetical protein